MNIAIGADHRGYLIKKEIIGHLESKGHNMTDCGTHSEEACDYPDIAYEVAKTVSEGQTERGVLICMSGIGMAITANKLKDVRAGLCHNLKSAKLSRQHNDANILVLASGEIDQGLLEIVDTWLAEPFEGGRHQRRVDKITQIDEKRS